MAEMLDDIAYLSEEIGPRPAGTEEEQQAALYIADELQKGAGFTTTIEDFSCNTNADLPKAICFGTAFVATLAAVVFPVVAIPALVLIALAAGVFIAGQFGIQLIDRFTKGGVSQNVVAKYSPNSGNEMKARKIILVANYDSGKESREYQGVVGRYLHLIRLATVASMCCAFVLLFVKTVFFASDTSAASVVFTVLLVICLILMALPLISCVLHKTAQYNSAANNNAAGVSVLLETARAVGSGLVSQEEMESRATEDGVVLEGEEAARAAGAIPDGAKVTYAAQAERELSPEESLAAAKAAIAALTGKPIADTVPVRDVASNLVQGDGFNEEGHEVEFKFDVTDVSQPVHEPQLAMYDFENDYAVDGDDDFELGHADDRAEGGAAGKRVPAESSRHVDDESAAGTASVEASAGIKHPAAVEAAGAVEAAEAATDVRAEANVANPVAEEAPAGSAPTPASAPSASNEDASIPAWARAAQAKARANKPEQTPPARSQRSRYADTVAARLTDEQLEHAHEGARPATSGSVEGVEFRSGWSAFTQGAQEPTASEALDERLASLHANINATEAPHFSSEVKSQMESAGTGQGVEALHGVSADEGQDAANASSGESVSSRPTSSASRAQQRRSRAATTNASQTLADKFQSISKRMKRSQAETPAEGEAQSERRGHHPEAMRDMPFSEQDQAQLAAEENAVADQMEESVFDRAMDHIDNAAEDLGRTSFISPIDVSGLIERVGEDEPAIDSASTASSDSASGLANGPSRTTATAPDGFEGAADELEAIYEEDVDGASSEGLDGADFAEKDFDEPAYDESDYAEGAVIEEEYYVSSDSGDGFVGQEAYAGTSDVDDPRFEPIVYEPAEEETFVNGWADAAQFQWTATPSVEALDDGYVDDEACDQDASFDLHGKAGVYEEDIAYEEDASYEESDSFAAESMLNGVAEGSNPAQATSQADAVAPVAPIAGMENLISAIPAADVVSRETNDVVPSRKVIVLPEVQAQRAHASEPTKQRAPMAATNESTRSGSQALLSNMIPKIDAEELAVPEIDAPKDRFGLNLPPLGVSESTNSSVSSTGSFATVGSTGPFAPVTDDLVADLAPDEVYVDDADDSSFEEEFTESGAFAGPGYVDMPASRVGGFLNRFRSKKNSKKKTESSVRDWVGVDESFTAQEAGKARGGWESFRQDGEEQSPVQAATKPSVAPAEASASQTESPRTKQANANQGGFVDVDYSENDYGSRDGWNGGAFSVESLRNLRGKKAADSSADNEDYDYAYEGEDAVGPVTVREVETPAVESAAQGRAEQINREIKRIQNFRHPEIDTEVWFVALGAELCGNSGMQAFVAEHREDLKGSIVINLEGLGAGKLTYIDHEGLLKPMKSSARMKRFLRNASQQSGVSFGTEAMCARTTPAYVAFQHGLQSMTLAGMKDGEPAFFGSMDDTMEIVDESALRRNASFVLALLKSI